MSVHNKIFTHPAVIGVGVVAASLVVLGSFSRAGNELAQHVVATTCHYIGNPEHPARFCRHKPRHVTHRHKTDAPQQ